MFNYENPEGKRRSLAQRERQKNKYGTGMVLGQVTSSSGSTETVKMIGIPSQTTVQHPYVSVNSWDRAQPEVGSLAMVSYNEESGEPLSVMYKNYRPEDMLNAYSEGNSLYRELSPGELDRMSSGMSCSYRANQPVHQSRTGLVELIDDGIRSVMFRKAPLIQVQMHQHESASLKDEYRLGVVRRPETAATDILVKAPTGETGFAKENTLVLMSKDGYLLDYREGHVIDDDGTAPMSSSTGKYLRVQKKVYTVKQTYSLLEVDNYGNVSYQLPNDATEGISLTVPKGRLSLDIGRDMSVTVTEDIAIQAQNKSTATIGGYLTKLGMDAAHPLIFGDDFVKALLEFITKLAVHTHPNTSPSPDLATASATFAQALPDCVSRNVETE